jgi:hypothetical protein
MRPYRSETRAHAANGVLNFPWWVPTRGRTGRLNTVAVLEIHAFLALDVDTADALGEDMWRYIRRLLIRGKGGRIIWDAQGDESRWEAIRRLGQLRWYENDTQASGVDGAVALSFVIPLRDFTLYEPTDFDVPAYEIESVEVQVGDDTTFDIGSAAVTIDSGNVHCIAYTREVDGIPIGAQWEFRTLGWQATAETTIPINNGLLRSAWAFARGASGGATLAAFDDHTIDGLIDQPWDERETPAYHAWAHGVSHASDTSVGGPVFGSGFGSFGAAGTPRVRALWMPPDGVKLRDLPHVPGNLVVRATNTVASLITGYTVVRPRSEALAQLVAREFGLGKGAFRVATKRGSRRDPRAWRGKVGQGFLPGRAPDPQDTRRPGGGQPDVGR